MSDTKEIPPGGFCYRVVSLKPGEVLSKDIDKFGKELREYPWHEGYKEVLCPYWRRTDYGMVRCEYMGVEELDEDDSEAWDKAIAHFGNKDAFLKANHPGYLYDEIKGCGIKEYEEEDWDSIQKVEDDG